MTRRPTPFIFYPVHHTGYRAPAIVVDAPTKEAAYSEAFSRCYLIQKFPNHWYLR